MQAVGYYFTQGREKVRRKFGIICMTCGIILIAASVSLAVYNYKEDVHAASAAEEVMPDLKELISERMELKPEEFQGSDAMTVVEIDGYGYIGYLSIPGLGLELPVMSEWDYVRLKIAPCLYYGSAKTDNMVIAAHNYAGFFGRLSELKLGDTVLFTDMDGEVYAYRVGDMEILPPGETEKMIKSQWELSLYTCTYGGASRVTLRCERVSGNA